jgi:hypothetical protein
LRLRKCAFFGRTRVRQITRVVEGKRDGASQGPGIRGILGLTPAHPQQAEIGNKRRKRHQRQEHNSDVNEDRSAIVASGP